MLLSSTFRKGAMNIQLQLLISLIREFGIEVGTDTSCDISYVTNRFESEGASFAEVTLPRLSKDLLHSLEEGSWISDSWQQPPQKFLGWLFRRIFDQDGTLLARPSESAISAVRQICECQGKVFEIPSQDLVDKALTAYRDCDDQVITELNSPYLPFVQMVFTHLNNRMKGYFDAFMRYRTMGHYGPGATAERLSANYRYLGIEYSARLDDVLPFGDEIDFNYRGRPAVLLEKTNERPVRVIPVPKDATKPRIIAVEPSYNQYVQQELMGVFYKAFSSPYFSDFIDLRDQTRNQILARQGSIYGDLSTLDLSEASDRLPYVLVKKLFHLQPYWPAMDASRSRTAEVDGSYPFGVYLKKWASMGSGLTFPVESLCFLSIVLAGVATAYGVEPSSAFIEDMRGRVSIYGDDIVCPTDTVTSVIQALESFGLKVNVSKSLYKGDFRESCGKEYYRGADITLVRLRRHFPESRHDVAEIVSLCRFRNLFFLRHGHGPVTDLCDSCLRRLIRYVPSFSVSIIETGDLTECKLLDRATHEGIYLLDYVTRARSRWNPSLQRIEYAAYCVKQKLRSDSLLEGDYKVDWKLPDGTTTPVSVHRGDGALRKFFVNGHIDKCDHLLRYGRPIRATLKYRWSPVWDLAERANLAHPFA